MEKGVYTSFFPRHKNDSFKVNNLEVELTQLALEVPEASTAANSFAVHEHVKHGRVEDLYKLIACVSNHGYQAVDKIASCLDLDGFAALHYAALQPSIVAARILLDNAVTLDIESKNGETPLHLALRHGNIPIANLLMDRGSSLKKGDCNGNNALHLAIERGLRSVAVKILMRCPFLVYSQTHYGFTALHYAAMQGDEQICEKLLSCEAKVTAVNANGETPLHLACLLNHVDVLKVLLEARSLDSECRGKYLDIPRKDNFTAIHIAAKMGHIETVRFLMESGIKVNASTELLPNALEMAAGDGHTEVVQLFLANGATINAADRYGNTALHRAAMNGQTEAVKLLLKNGANIEAVNEDGWSPLFFSVSRLKHDVTKILLEHGADSNRLDSKLCCCLHYAVKADDCKIIPLLLQNGGNGLIFRRNIYNKLIIHEAVMSGNEKILEMLLHRCSGTIIFCEGNKTLIHLAAQLGQLSCLKKLIDIWPREYLDLSDTNQQTALHLAAMNGYLHICHYLIESKANINCIDKKGRKPLHLAITNTQNEVVKLLIDAKTELVPEDTSTAIKAGNVQSLTMLLDQLAVEHVGTAGSKLNALEEALNGDHEGVVEAIVDHSSFQTAVKYNNISLENLMPKMIMKYPEVVMKVLNKGITFSDHPFDCKELEISYDFSALEAAPSTCNSLFCTEMYFGPAIMAEWNREECLAHPLTQKLINLMWASKGGIVFYSSLLVYLAFIISLTTLVVLERQEDLKSFGAVTSINSTQSAVNNTTASSCTSCKREQPTNIHVPSTRYSLKILAYFIFVFLCLTAVKELIQIMALGFRYCKDFANFLEWKVMIHAFGYLNGFLFMNYKSKNAEITLAVCSLFFGWLNLLLFLRRSPMFNIYAVMFTQVILTLIRVLFVFTPLLLAFSLAFNQLFIAQTTFKDVWNSYMKTFVMFSGELEYGDTIPNSIGKVDEQSSYPLVPLPWISYALFSAFIIMIPIALMNLLVGLAVGDIESIRKTAKHNVMKQQARYMKDLNEKFPKFVMELTYRRFYKERPNDVHWLRRILNFGSVDKEFAEFIQGRVKKEEVSAEERLEDKLDNLQNSLQGQQCQVKKIYSKLDEHTRILKDLKS